MENKRPVRLTGLAVVLLVVVVCIVAYFLATRIVDANVPQLDTAIPIPASSNHQIEPLGNGLVYYDGSTLHAMDARGRQIWSYPAGAGASFNVSEGGVCTWSGMKLSLLNRETGSVLFSGNLNEGNIIDAKLGRAYAAVQVEAENSSNQPLSDASRAHSSHMLLLDAGGRRVDKIDLLNQTPVDFGFFNADQLFWVMSLDTQGTLPICVIRSYKPGRMLNGEVKDEEQTLYTASFQASKIRVAGLKYVKDYDYYGVERPNSRILVYGWYMTDMDTDENGPTMAFSPVSQTADVGISDIRVIRDQQDTRIHLPEQAEQVFVKNGSIYAFSRDRVMILPYGAQVAQVYGLPMVIERVIDLTDGHSAIVQSGQNIFLIPLH